MRPFWITEDAKLRAAAPEWGALCDRAPGCPPFARPEWLLPWRQVFGGGTPLRALAIEDAGTLVALLPFHQVETDGGPGLALMGGEISDHHGGGCDPDRHAEVRCVVTQALDDGPWVTVTLDRLRADSWLRPLVAARRWRGVETPEDTPCPELAAPPGARQLSDLLPAGFAHRLDRQRRKAERGGLSLRAASTVDEALSMFDALSDFHAARWRARGEPGVLAHPDVQRFHRLVIAAMQRAGVLRLYALELSGRLAAVAYGFAAHGRMSFYLSGFDPAQETASPGMLVIAGAIERELAAGVRVFDFLRGREAYKYRFGAADAACFTIVWRRQARGAALDLQSGAGASISSRV